LPNLYEETSACSAEVRHEHTFSWSCPPGSRRQFRFLCWPWPCHPPAHCQGGTRGHSASGPGAWRLERQHVQQKDVSWHPAVTVV